MKIIIFGISGQDGFYLKRLCEDKGYEVTGVSRSDGDWIKGSVADYELVARLIKELRPYCVFHLAANSSTRHDLLFENNAGICDGTANILEAVYQFSPETKVFLSGSALQFVNKDLPIKETDEFHGGSPYAVQRIYSTYLSRYYRSLGIRSYVGYFFHHDSPLRGGGHLNVRIIKMLKQIKQGASDTLEIGDPGVIKEYNYAGDLMNAVWLLIQQDIVSEAVIGCGEGHSVLDWVDTCRALLGIPAGDYVKTIGGFNAEFKKMVSDPATIKSLGWQPVLDMKALAQMMVSKYEFS